MISEFSIEIALLGALMRDDSLLARVDLQASDFETGTHAIIFQVMQNMSGPRDLFTVGDYLETRAKRQWLPVLGNILKQTWSTANYQAYAAGIKQRPDSVS